MFFFLYYLFLNFFFPKFKGLSVPFGFIDLIKGGSESNNESLLKNSYSKYGTMEVR